MLGRDAQAEELGSLDTYAFHLPGGCSITWPPEECVAACWGWAKEPPFSIYSKCELLPGAQKAEMQRETAGALDQNVAWAVAEGISDLQKVAVWGTSERENPQTQPL